MIMAILTGVTALPLSALFVTISKEDLEVFSVFLYPQSSCWIFLYGFS
jgi:hypothetical protein